MSEICPKNAVQTASGRGSRDLVIELISPRERQRFERDPSVLADTVRALRMKKPVIVVDEIQKVPQLLDVAQELIDSGCGSPSAMSAINGPSTGAN